VKSKAYYFKVFPCH